MPIITFSSFGDIVAVLQLAWKLRAALSEATGASAEIHELLVDIDSFIRTLEHVKASMEQRRTPLQPSVEHGIKHAIIACHAVLQAILARLTAFKTRMTRKVGAVAWRQYWAITAWSILGGKKEVDALRMRLSEQLDVIHTYLALAHADAQSAIQNLVERQATTLERVFSVVQDIQLRFDVGVPSFQFYNALKKEYYQPFARTSLTRFIQLLKLYQKHQYPDELEFDTESDPAIVQKTLATAQTLCVMKHKLINTEFNSGWSAAFDCCYFREHAFGEWQVLIGHCVLPPEILRVYKHLVEREHALHTACNCDRPSYKVQFREEIQRAHYARDMGRTLAILNQLAALGLVMQADDAHSHYQMCKEIFTQLRRCPKRSYLRHTIIPLLKIYVEHQRPSGDHIVTLLQNIPLSGFRLELRDLDWPVELRVAWNMPLEWPSEWLATAPDIPKFLIIWDAIPPALVPYL